MLLDFLVKECAKSVNADRATIILFDEKRNELRSRVSTGVTDVIRFDARSGIAGEVFKSGKSINVKDAYSHPKFNPEVDKRTGYTTKTILCAPIKEVGGKIIGVLQALNKKEGVFSEGDEEALDVFASHAAKAILNVELTGELGEEEAENIIPKEEKGRPFAGSILGMSSKIQEVIALIGRVSDSSISVLITGESGTGKELAARTIHMNSSRSEKPFIDINCAALPESLLESELFGIEKGVATGVEKRIGKIETAGGGTLFLDEIGDMSLYAQAMLLRVLQERRIERVGGRGTITVDVRVIAATNKDLNSEIKRGSFREDLYYRLSAVRIHMPSLRDIREDIPHLANHFLSTSTNEIGKGSMSFSPEAMDCLMNYSWPGNVRELENEVKRAAILANSDVIEESNLSESVRGVAQSPGFVGTTPAFKGSLEEIETQTIKEALERSGGNKKKAAKILGLTRQGLAKKIKKFENPSRTGSSVEDVTPITNHTPHSKPVEIDRQPLKQGDKGAEASAIESEHKVSEVVPPFDKAQGSPQAERRQLTVMFCDLADFSTLSEELDPEEIRDLVSAYQRGCAQVVYKYGGYIVQYLGDGLLISFGYPTAHEDDAQRALRAGLEIVRTISELSLPGKQLQRIIEARVGIHTGLAVIGEMGSENMPKSVGIMGEVPNIAARLLGVAEPNTVLISSATYRLVEGLFECCDLGLHRLEGVSSPLNVYRVLNESKVQSKFELAVTRGLTPLVGREQEVELLLERWERVREGEGQVVLLCGEPGIGKSRLVQVMKERLAGESHVRIESRCLPYYQNSTLYPLIDHLRRLLELKREDSPEERLRKLEEALKQYGFSLEQTVPLFASLLSLPIPDCYPPLDLTSQRQKQKTLEAMLFWLHKEAEKHPVLFVGEDLHWADPSTLEFLGLLVEQVPTSRIFTLFTYRHDFSPPWTSRAYMTQITLNRLTHKQVEVMIEKVAGGKALPSVVAKQIVSKADGVPLFVEELTKMVIESELLKERESHYELTIPQSFSLSIQLAIPPTLHDSLMARLDRLTTVKEVAQLGAAVGREFTYELLKAISPLDETSLQRELSRLVEAELLYQRGIPPQSRYFFKHALIQDAAYQSLLKSRRQEYHHRIAQVLEERFPETVEIQPELLAHHYTEAGLKEQAIAYWRIAGQKATQLSANAEAIAHLTKALELLKTLPDTLMHAQQELTLQTALGVSLRAIKGYAAPEVEGAYSRARELCQYVGDTPHLLPILRGLSGFYIVRGELKIALELAGQLLTLAQSIQDQSFLVEAHLVSGVILFYMGEFIPAKSHLEQGISIYDSQQLGSHTFLYGQDPGVVCRSIVVDILYLLGYPDQAMKRSHEAIALAQGLNHPPSLVFAQFYVARLHHFRRESKLTQEWSETTTTLSAEYGLPYWSATGTILRGWALAEQGQGEIGITQILQGLATLRATGTELTLPYYLTLLAGSYGKVGRSEEGLTILADTLRKVNDSGIRWCEAEIYRIKGELLMMQAEGSGDLQAAPTEIRLAEADTCFRQAIDIARRQGAKTLELQAAISLSRLWQSQGKKEEAREVLAETYGWFTEGFETVGLKEARALLDELA